MRAVLLAAVTATGCLEAPPSAESGDDGAIIDAAPIDCVCPDDPCPFQYVRAIRVHTPQSGTDLTQVPVLVRVETSGHMAAGGSDLRFATPDGALLAHEIELFPPSGGSAAIWVGLPVFPAGRDVGLCLFYGADSPGGAPDPTGVWDSSFAAIWHLGEEGEGTADEFADSTSRGCSGLGGGGSAENLPQRVEAQVGGGQAFAGDDYITFGTGSHLDLTGTGITLEAWTQFRSFPDTYMGILNKEGFSSGYRIMIGDAGEVLLQLTSAERRLETDAMSAPEGSWHHVAGTYDGATMRVYVDGALREEKAASGPLDSNEVPLHVGQGQGVGTFGFTGSLDEVRISTVARSAAWLAVQHDSVIGELVMVGDEQQL